MIEGFPASQLRIGCSESFKTSSVRKDGHLVFFFPRQIFGLDYGACVAAIKQDYELVFQPVGWFPRLDRDNGPGVLGPRKEIIPGSC